MPVVSADCTGDSLTSCICTFSLGATAPRSLISRCEAKLLASPSIAQPRSRSSCLPAPRRWTACVSVCVLSLLTASLLVVRSAGRPAGRQPATSETPSVLLCAFLPALQKLHARPRGPATRATTHHTM
jgi:hypothetical protein